MNCECAICSNNKPFDMPKEIIDAVVKEELVLFCGAGVSTEKKTVLPYSFYSNIRDELDITDDLSFCDLMQKYNDRPNGRRNLLKKIRERFKYIDSFPELHRQATAFHRELSQIYQIKTIITTNWDTYFEEYCGAVPITIPEDISLFDDTSRHVLKIHGSINNLSSIVATKSDYEACYERLQNGVIGAQLKNILATKTVVFIVFSFGDEDFSQILKYLKNEMGNVFPHIYVVTIDDKLEKRLNYDNCTPIVTSGEHFIHTLKNYLKENGSIVNTGIEEDVEISLSIMEDLHGKVSRINIKTFPSVIYTLGCPRESIEGISTMQTGGLVELFKKFCPTQTGELKTLNKVLLMSSENIHINSFMFEPLIDISIKSLVDLFGDICILQPPVYSE